MTTVRESAVWLDCEGAAMLGVLALPSPDAAGARGIGVLIVVGGPQYRVGSHRQFTLLARRLAAAGFPTLRFDCRGMGDSEGEMRGFLEVEPDIAAAAAALRTEARVREVVLWGLCDAASALLLGPAAAQCVAGLVLVNPWVRSAESLAATQLKHYYAARIWNRHFWRKLVTGRIDWSESFLQFYRSVRAALGRMLAGGRRHDTASFQTRMAQGLRAYDRPVLLVLSGNDMTAMEFVDYAERDPHWHGLLADGRISRAFLEGADHTFSRSEWHAWLEDRTLGWLDELVRRGTRLEIPANGVDR